MSIFSKCLKSVNKLTAKLILLSTLSSKNHRLKINHCSVSNLCWACFHDRDYFIAHAQWQLSSNFGFGNVRVSNFLTPKLGRCSFERGPPEARIGRAAVNVVPEAPRDVVGTGLLSPRGRHRVPWGVQAQGCLGHGGVPAGHL